jgi:hypothetical protein
MSAWRVTFAYDGDRVRVIGKQRVDTMSPPDDSDNIADVAAGYWVEVRDAQGESLHRQVLANPLNDQLEVFSPDPTQPLHRIDAPAPSGVFQVLVPDDPAGHDIVLHGRALSAEVNERASRQLVRSVLREQDFTPESLA